VVLLKSSFSLLTLKGLLIKCSLVRHTDHKILWSVSQTELQNILCLSAIIMIFVSPFVALLSEAFISHAWIRYAFDLEKEV
jgi:ABC-type uncharacterized transport system permease subunit